ncbi:MAG: C39 family peptidase [Parcubacteria group bacterium]
MKTKLAMMMGFFFFFIGAEAAAEQAIAESVPFKTQSPPGDWAHNMNCGPAAALMAIGTYFNFVPKESDIKEVLDWLYEKQYLSPQPDAEYYDGNATSVWHLQKIISEYYHLPMTRKKNDNDLEYLKGELKKGNPVIVGVNIQMDPGRAGHFMLAVGVEDGEILVHDPGKTAGAYNRYSLERFERSWRTSNYASLVIVNEYATWHPDGTLLKRSDQADIFILISGRMHLIMNEAVFDSHQFDWQKIIPVGEEELDCYEYGGLIDWRPEREVFQVGDAIYLKEKTSASATNCAVYRFSSRFSYFSWNIPGGIKPVSRAQAQESYFDRCDIGEVLYTRAGAVLKPEFDLQNYDSGAYFVQAEHGVLLPFEDNEVFKIMGYANLPVLSPTPEEFFSSFLAFGDMITLEKAEQCLSRGDLQIAGDYSAAGGQDVDGRLDGGQDGGDGRGQSDGGACLPGQIFYNEECYYLNVESADAGMPDAGMTNQPENGADDGGLRDAGMPDAGIDRPENNVQDGGFCDAGMTVSEEFSVTCTVSCPPDMRAYVWYATNGHGHGQPVTFTATKQEICERGRPWADFNCACTFPYEWACYDWQSASVSCSREFRTMQGIVDYRGEGEIWFTDFTCFD